MTNKDPQVQQLHDQLQIANGKIAALTDQRNVASDQAASIYAQFAALQKRNSELTHEVATLAREVTALKARLAPAVPPMPPMPPNGHDEPSRPTEEHP